MRFYDEAYNYIASCIGVELGSLLGMLVKFNLNI